MNITLSDYEKGVFRKLAKQYNVAPRALKDAYVEQVGFEMEDKLNELLNDESVLATIKDESRDMGFYNKTGAEE